MWDLRGLDLKKLDIKGWDETSETPRFTYKYKVGPEAKEAASQAASSGGPAPVPWQQPPAPQNLPRGDFSQELEQAISRCVSKLGRMQEERLNEMFHPQGLEQAIGRCVSKLGRMQEERLNEMFHEQHTLLDTSLRRLQNQLAEHAAVKAAASSAIAVATETEGAVAPAVADIEAKVSRLVDLAEEGQRDLNHCLVQTRQAVRDAIGEKLDTTLVELIERMPKEASVQDTSTSETPVAERKRMMTGVSKSVLFLPEQQPVDEDEGTTPESPPSRVPSAMGWVRSMGRARKDIIRRQMDVARESKLARLRSKETCAQTVARSVYTEMALGFVIAAQSVLMALETDRSFENPFSLSTRIAIESVFLCIYTAELSLRIGVERSAFLASKLNILDAFLVLAGFCDVILLVAISEEKVNAGPLKALRILRLQKVLRLYHVFKLMPDTYLVLESLCACGNALLGSAMLVFVFILVCAILVGSSVSVFLLDGGGALGDDELEYYRENFGGVRRCMLTLYQSVTSGLEWADVYGALTRMPGQELSVLFLMFHFVFQFLMVNILTSIYVQKVMFFSTEDTQVAQYNTYVRDRADTLELLGRCEKKFGVGEFLNYKEFLDFMLDSRVHRKFDTRHIKFNEAKMVHAMLAKPVPGENPSDEWRYVVNRADFLEACMRLKHDHMVLDTVMASTSNRMYMEGLRDQGDRLSASLETVQKKLDALSHRSRHPALSF